MSRMRVVPVGRAAILRPVRDAARQRRRRGGGRSGGSVAGPRRRRALPRAGRIGTGGMGVVYRVEHLHLGKTAAMKVLSPDTASKPETIRRFRLEAQSVSKLNHPNIVQTFDFGQFDGALYLVMEYIKGDDLSSLLRREGPWSFARAARFFMQVCSGLTEAHDAGIVHRDLKPENLMVVHRREGVGARRSPRLRPGEAARARRRRARDQRGRAGDRDALLHGAGAGARRGSRRARRSLQPRRHALSRADG